MADKKNELIITRIFDAPVKSVWEAWTKAGKVMCWWGPKIFTSPSCKIDFRVGGKYLFCMRSDSGPEAWQKGIWSTGVYKQIVPMRKIVMTDCFADEQGNVVPSTYYGMEGFPSELEVTLTFEEDEEGKTEMTLKHRGVPAQMKEECRTGWTESFDKLDKCLRMFEIEKDEKEANMAKKVKPIPQGYHSVTPSLVIRGAREAIEFYKKTLGAELTFIQDRPDGKVMHGRSRSEIRSSCLLMSARLMKDMIQPVLCRRPLWAERP